MRGKRMPFKWSNLLSYFRPAYPACHICKRRRKPDQQISCCEDCASKMAMITKVSCMYCGRPTYCADCIRSRAPLQPPPALIAHRSAAEYDTFLKHCIALYKYRGQERMQTIFGYLLINAFQLLSKYDGQSHSFDAITYVPISGPRAQERGFNQAEQLAQQLGEYTGLPVIPLLNREKHTAKQSQQSKLARRQALVQVYSFKTDEWQKWLESTGNTVPNAPARTEFTDRKWNLIIVDDVYTTGSTMEACAAVLVKELNANVYGITLGRA